MSRNAPMAIISTIGLPGSGKTTICQSLVNAQNLGQNNEGIGAQTSDVSYILISFDDLQHLSSTNNLVGPDLYQADSEVTPYKLFRRAVLRLVDALIQHIMSGEILHLPDLFNFPSVHKYLCERLTSVSTSLSVCLVVDDNMYYRSMRYPYYQLARKYGLGYGQIFVNTPIDICLNRNAHRHGDQQVNEQIIVGMRERLEPPAPAINVWEQNSIEVAVSSIDDLQRFVGQCLGKPVLPGATPSDSEREESAKITGEDVIHQSDLILRQLVKQRISAAQKGGRDVKQVAAKANSCRRQTLTYVKTHCKELSEVLTCTQHPSKDSSSALFNFVETVYGKQMEV